MATQDDYTRITLRIPKDLHQQLADAAESTSKSMNAEIVARLAESFAPPMDGHIDPHVIEQKLNELASRHLHATLEWTEILADIEEASELGRSALKNNDSELSARYRDKYRELLSKRAAAELEMRSVESSIATYEAILSGKRLK